MASAQDLALKLLRRAEDDQAATVALLDVSSVSDALAGFHAQQAVEKSLKAVLALNGMELSIQPRPATADRTSVRRLTSRCHQSLTTLIGSRHMPRAFATATRSLAA
jgi:hypothetical protein